MDMTQDATDTLRQPGPGRPRSFDEAAVLAAALEVFWRQGFESTSLDDLTGATGLSRSSFYGYFGCKRSVLLAALREYADTAFGALEAISAAAPSPLRAVEAMVAAIADTRGGPRGCLLVNCVTELAPSDAEVREMSLRHITRVEALVAGRLAEAGIQDASERACALVALGLGAVTLRKAGVPAARIDAAILQMLPTPSTAI